MSCDTDETPGVLIDLPVSEILAKAGEEGKPDIHTITYRYPFTGLVKAAPRKALSALTLAGRQGDYAQQYWASIMNEFPMDAAPRLRRVFLNRVARLPHAVIVGLAQTFAQWLARNLAAILEWDSNLAWKVYDHVVDALIAGGADATKSPRNEVYYRGTIARWSRRTFEYANVAPIGACTAALFSSVPGGPDQCDSLVPAHIRSRATRLFAAPGEGSDHAVAIACSQLNHLMHIDPAWTTELLVPMLAFEHPSAEPAWSGFLHRRQMPSLPLAAIIKPLLLRLFPWIEGLAWQREFSATAAAWLGTLRIFHQDQSYGLSQSEMRGALRAMSDETRNHFIVKLGHLGHKQPDGWAKYVIPFINEDWPRERRYRTNASTGAWIALLGGSGTSFPNVYEAVKEFLVAVETTDQPFARFSRKIGQDEALTTLFPDTALDLMHTSIPQVLMRVPYDLPKVLAMIAEAKPDLLSDPRYLRLIELVEQC